MLTLIFISVFLFGFSSSANPGVKVALSEEALQYAATKAVEHMHREVKNFKVPDVVTDTYKVENVEILQFSKPTANVTIDSGEGLTIKLKGGEVAMKARWAVKMWWFWLKGLFEATSNSITASFTTKVTVVNGKPYLTAGSCEVFLGGFKLQNSGFSFNFLINLLVGNSQGSLQEKVQTEICNILVNLVDDNANKDIANLKFVFPIIEDIDFDFHLTEQPIFLENRVVANLKGRALADSQTTFDPSILSIKPDKMGSLSLSEASINSVCRAVHEKNLFKFKLMVTDENVKNLFPTNNDSIYSSTITTAPLLASITPDGLFLNLSLFSTFTNPGLLMEAQGNYTVQMKMLENNKHIIVNVSVVESLTEVVNPSYELSGNFTNVVNEYLVREVEMFINAAFGKGFHVPTFDLLGYTDVVIAYDDQQVMMAADAV